MNWQGMKDRSKVGQVWADKARVMAKNSLGQGKGGRGD
jgi:hypothetical protein